MTPTIRHLHEHGELEAACALVATVWGLDSDDAPINKEVLRALGHSGNYVVGAFDSTQLVGVSIGFLGHDAEGWLLHSHITCVALPFANRGLGASLKQHQREWTLAKDVKRISWTFDPLIRRNAYFNLARLGARAVDYHEAFYGTMRDAINVGDESDRCVAMWELGSTHDPLTSVNDVVSEVILEPGVAIASDDAEPIAHEGLIGSAAVLRAYVPADIEAMRMTKLNLALRWRAASRATIGAAMHQGYQATKMSKNGWYTLQRNR